MGYRKDILWKNLLELVFEDLLRFVFPDADGTFDLQRGFGFLDKELGGMGVGPDGKIDVRIVDKLVKVYRKEGGEDWVLVHIEVQGQTPARERPIFPERMFRYFYRCFDLHRRPIIAIAILCGPDGKRFPRRYEYSFMNTRVQYDYHTVNLSDYTDEELEKSVNPFAWVLRVARDALIRGDNIDERLLKGKLYIFRKLFENGIFERRKLQAILFFLKNYVQFRTSESGRTFKREVNKITNKKNNMTMFDLMAKDAVKTQRRKDDEKAVRLLLAHTRFSKKKIASLVRVSVALVERLSKGVRKK